MSDFDLNALIDRALSGKEPDPHVIAKRLMPKVPRDERDALLASLLVERVTLRMRMARSAWLADDLARGQTAIGAEPALASGDLAADRLHSDTHVQGVGGNSRSRWQKHFPNMRDRYKVGGEWKFKDALTAEECREIANDYARRATANQTLATHFANLCLAIEQAGVSTVGELRNLGERAA